MVIAGHKSIFPFSPTEKVTLQQLAAQPILINRRYYRLFQSIGAKENLTFQYYCLNNDARTTLYWANASLGIGIVPKETALIQSYPDLCFSEIDCPELFTQLCAIWPKNKPISKIDYHGCGRAADFFKFIIVKRSAHYTNFNNSFF